jgi:serine/threonine protein kinase
MPAPGDTVDRFTIEELLGRGGMASVYRVRHTTLGSDHALKVLDLTHGSIRDRLKLEGRLQARLAHPHIVSVTDMIEVEGSPGLIMEYVPGFSLDVLLKRIRPDPATIDQLFRPILDAVIHAHRSEVVHRDLKPGNVLVQEVDGRLVPKVSDFGLAKLLGEEDSGHKPTRTGFAMGTPGYMAPEQIRSAKHADQRADVFSLGCILYELWCGEAPFRGDSVYDVLVSIEAREFTRPRALRPDLPDSVERAILACLEPDPDKRLPSAQALRDALYPAPGMPDKQVPALVQPVQPVQPASHKPLVLAQPAPSALQALQEPASFPQPPVHVRPATKPRPRSSSAAGWIVLLVLLVTLVGVVTVGISGIVLTLGAVAVVPDTGF